MMASTPFGPPLLAARPGLVKGVLAGIIAVANLHVTCRCTHVGGFPDEKG